jgi:hypothetical protein
MVGQGVLREWLLDPEVKTVLAVAEGWYPRSRISRRQAAPSRARPPG